MGIPLCNSVGFATIEQIADGLCKTGVGPDSLASGTILAGMTHFGIKGLLFSRRFQGHTTIPEVR